MSMNGESLLLCGVNLELADIVLRLVQDTKEIRWK